jgi:hypothetical protein
MWCSMFSSKSLAFKTICLMANQFNAEVWYIVTAAAFTIAIDVLESSEAQQKGKNVAPPEIRARVGNQVHGKSHVHSEF